ncbi:hypothetical protein SAMN00017405_0953 [Desulfonispora thiosulfatigenes DSM 11270]|uniref:Uncharacterized protein n=1 Tax=Desulfonispora thiosulfatigenes DSM 11270 TaxID=656914 RepID=A0A1W1UPN7_DESTI|nr:hypothetical protein [Desulfonispora thiosulfatigenes]SMB82674.1 hypothetical protein SAMN00017405_0953 [Desulfonispora thiosulfatigenes DSM 11270]
MAKEMNELDEMFANVGTVNQDNLFDGEEDVDDNELDFFDDEELEELDQGHDDVDFEYDENELDEEELDLDADTFDESDEDDDDDDFEVDESDEDDDDLFTLKESLRQPKLDETDYLGTVGKPKAEKEEGKYGPWVKITLPFIIKNPETGEKVTVPFVANRSMDPRSRLYSILKGILGAAPTSGFNLKGVEGKKVRVSIEHRTDEKGNVWENVIVVRPFRKKR